MSAEGPMVHLDGLRFAYPGADQFRLRIDHLAATRGERVAVVGPSGSGKTTLLGLLAGVLRPDAGRVEIDGTDLGALGERAGRRFRIRKVGQVFQAFELLNYLDVTGNVMLPHYIQRQAEGRQALRRRALDLLDTVGLAHKAAAMPQQLSQGEKQRVAVCRAMLNRPALLLADEPTGNLDQENKQTVVDLLIEQAERHDSTLLMVTHDRSLLTSFSTVLDMRDLATGERP